MTCIGEKSVIGFSVPSRSLKWDVRLLWKSIKIKIRYVMKTTGLLLSAGHLQVIGTVAAVLLFVACSNDLTTDTALQGGVLRFEVAEASD